LADIPAESLIMRKSFFRRFQEAFGPNRAAFALAGDRIMANAVADYGELRVELRDEFGAVIEGYGAADSAPLGADSTAAAMAWQHGPSVLALRHRPVRLRFLLRNARLYSYWAE